MLKSIKTSVLAAILISTAVVAHAQKKVNEGTITYGMTYELGADQQSLASQLPAETKYKFSGNISKIKMDQGGATIVFLTDGVTKNGLVLVSIPMMQKQYAAKSTKEDGEAMMGKTAVYSDFKATGEKMKIGNYNAEKYTYKDDKGAGLELWATTELVLPEGITGTEFKDVKGTPVKFTKTQNGIKATVVLKDVVEDKVGPLSLEAPAGYEAISLADLKAMGGQ
jgi:hypothetical protein